MTKSMRLVRVVNELNVLHTRYIAWCERRNMGHAYEVECRTVLQLCEDFLAAEKQVRDVGATAAECALPYCALTVIERHVLELRGTLDRIEREEAGPAVVRQVKW